MIKRKIFSFLSFFNFTFNLLSLLKDKMGVGNSKVNSCDSEICTDFQFESVPKQTIKHKNNYSINDGYITYEPKGNKFSIQTKKSKHTRQIFIKNSIHTSLKPLTQ